MSTNNAPILNMDAEKLDAFLAKGWYRMGQMIFTTDYIQVDESGLHKVNWLRYNLQNFCLTTSHQKLLKRNSQFKVTISPLVINDELEFLYKQYASNTSFETYTSLTNNLLYTTSEPDVQFYHYPSYVIKVYDANSIIAAGVLDDGKNSIAGIVNIFNPQYAKYSLGKFLMLQKLLYAQSIGKAFYYPGYIVEGYAKFDYKLFLGYACAELWDTASEQWENKIL